MKRTVGGGVLLLSSLSLVIGTMAVALAADEPTPIVPQGVPTAVQALTPDDCAPPADPFMSACFGDLNDPNNPYVPGTPRGEVRNQGDIGTATTADSIAEVSRAKQWIRVPWSRIFAQAYNVSRRGTAEEPIRGSWTGLEANAYVLSPAGSAHAYGDFPPTRVRSVAFGSVPATYTVHVSQARDENDLPIPLHGVSYTGSADPAKGYTGGGNIYMNEPLTGQVTVRVSDLKVDGVAVDLGANCRTSEPVEVHLEGKGFWAGDPELTTASLPGEYNGFTGPGEPGPAWAVTEPWKDTEYYHGPAGGLLTGSISVPAFTGCGSGAEDLSMLVTSLASSSDNDMKTRQGPTYQFGCFPIPDTPANTANYWWVLQDSIPCQASRPFPYPTGGSDG